MKYKLIILFLTVLHFNGFSQDMYTSRKGTKFFPGHLDIVVTVDSNTVRYELFNHWYSASYSCLRQITIPIDELKEFNQNNDSIKIMLQSGGVKLTDKRYHLSKKVKHKKLCTSVSNMRKISLANKIPSEQKTVSHFELYSSKDLEGNEETFLLPHTNR